MDFIIVPQAAAISCLDLFPLLGGDEPSLLVAGSTDGAVHILKRKNSVWKHEKRIAFHKAAVNDVDIHATGKMAFTVGRSASHVSLLLHF